MDLTKLLRRQKNVQDPRLISAKCAFAMPLVKTHTSTPRCGGGGEKEVKCSHLDKELPTAMAQEFMESYLHLKGRSLPFDVKVLQHIN